MAHANAITAVQIIVAVVVADTVAVVAVAAIVIASQMAHTVVFVLISPTKLH
jgi:hypothetical protein